MITRDVDEVDGIIFVVATGFWTRSDVDTHYDRLRDLIAVQRNAGRTIRVLIDIRDAPHQPVELEDHALAQMRRTYQPNDRVAILTAHPGVQAYVQARLGDLNIMVFASALPAEMWLVLE
jgi:hypothetical protein